MIKNYFKIALRNLTRNKGYTTISLFGLVTGIASALVLTIFAFQELTFDSNHHLRSEIFLVYKERKTPSGTRLVYDTWVPTLDAMKSDYPDVKAGTRLYTTEAFVTVDEKKFSEQLTLADTELFSIFDLPLHNGNGHDLLKDKSNLILSEETAVRFFGEADPVGRQIRLMANGRMIDLTVAGIFQEIPQNSSVRPTMVASFENAMDMENVAQAGWGGSFLLTYIYVDPERAAALEAQFPGLVKKYFDEETATRMQFKLLALPDYHNQLTQSNRTAYTMLIIAFIITLIAVVNYINLSTVRSIERAREIGVRKVLGASRFGLINQFLSESMTLTALAFIGSIVLLQAFGPFINQVLETTVDFNFVSNPMLLLAVIAAFLLIGFASGSFPALFISRYRTVESIKGKLKSTSVGLRLRRILIVFQLALSIVLLFSTLVVYKQVNFMRNHEIGINKENVVVIPTDTDNMADPEGTRNRLQSLKSELLQHSQIKQISSSDIVPSDLSNTTHTLVRPDGWTEEQPFRILRVSVDESYFPLYEIEILEGENFHVNMAVADTAVRNLAFINEAAMRAFGWDAIDGKKIGPRTQVVGLVRDHHYDNLALPVEPAMFFYRATQNQSSNYVSIRIAGEPSDVLPLIEQRWKSLDPSRPFTYFFVDSNFDNLYRLDLRNFKIISWFSGLAIVITCLGLFGLISFTVTQKVKEIGIRKVLGSSVMEIVFLLNREFLFLIAIAIVIGIPTAYYAMNYWLTGFALQTTIPLLLPVLIVLATAALVFATTSLRIWRAAMANPVESIKVE